MRNSFLRICIFLGMLTLLGACMHQQVAELRESCDFRNDPQFASLRGKIPLSPSEVETPPTLSEISNNMVPTAKEAQLIVAFDALNEVCVRRALDILRKNSNPGVVAIVIALRQNNLRELKLLAERKTTFGRYRQISYQYFIAANRELQGELNAMAVIDAQQSAASSSMLSAGAALLGSNRPVSGGGTSTSCRRYGSTLTCQHF